MIKTAAKVFQLSSEDTESLANKAGYTLTTGTRISWSSHRITNKKLCDNAQVSERMFYHIKSGRIPTKITLLALAISLQLNTDKIEELLQKAGYVLSKSIALDMVVKCLINKHKLHSLMQINDVLHELELPLLMTREMK